MPGRTRAIKATDRNKAWNRKSKPSNYRIETIPIKKTILIVCEGQTEKVYFESFPVLGAKVKTIDLTGQSKLKLIESTKEIIENTRIAISLTKPGHKGVRIGCGVKRQSKT